MRDVIIWGIVVGVVVILMATAPPRPTVESVTCTRCGETDTAEEWDLATIDAAGRLQPGSIHNLAADWFAGYEDQYWWVCPHCKTIRRPGGVEVVVR